MNVFAASNNHQLLGELVQTWLEHECHGPQQDKPVLDELSRLGILTPEERERVFIEHQCVEHGHIAVCDFVTCDEDSHWLVVRPDGTCTEV